MIRRIAAALSIGIVAVMGAAAQVQAAGTEPLEATVTPKRVSFGKIDLGTSVVQDVTVTNSGIEPLIIDSVEYLQAGGSGGFTAVDFDLATCQIGVVLAPNETCTYSIRLTAGVSGRVFGTFCILTISQQGDPAEDACTRYSGVIHKRR